MNPTIEDLFVEVFLEAIPDMSTEELAQIEFAIGVELQERAHNAAIGASEYLDGG